MNTIDRIAWSLLAWFSFDANNKHAAIHGQRMSIGAWIALRLTGQSLQTFSILCLNNFKRFEKFKEFWNQNNQWMKWYGWFYSTLVIEIQRSADGGCLVSSTNTVPTICCS